MLRSENSILFWFSSFSMFEKRFLLFYFVYTRLASLQLLGILISLCFICLWKPVVQMPGYTPVLLHRFYGSKNDDLGLDYKFFCPPRYHTNLLYRFSTRSNAQDFMIVTKVQRIHLVLEV